MKITHAGMYRARNGKLVTVHAIYEGSHFPVKGSRWTKRLGQKDPPFDTWTQEGRRFPLNEDGWDIVECLK